MVNDIVNRLKKILPLCRRICMLIATIAAIGAFIGVFVVSDIETVNIICKLVTVIGVIYIVSTISIFINPIRRDWMLMKKNFVLRLINFVLFIPFIMTSLFIAINPDISPRRMVGDEICYPEQVAVNEDDMGEIEAVEQYDKILSEQQAPHIIWTVYYHFIDAGNQHLALTPKGRGYAALMSMLGVFFMNGLLISTITSTIDRRRARWISGEVRYNRLLRRKKHYVVIGGIDLAMGVIKQLFDINAKRGCVPYILVQTDGDVEAFRAELYSMLDDEYQQQHVIIYRGSRTSYGDIEALMLHSAEEVYIFGEECREDTDEKYHDVRNMNCLELVSEIYAKGNSDPTRRLTCRMMFEYQTSYSVFQFSEVSNRIKNRINFVPFNFYEMWAQKVLICRELNDYANVPYLPIEGVDGISSESDSYVHFVILGMSPMAVAMATEVAHLAHYPNFETKRRRTRITIIDEDMLHKKNYFIGRFISLFKMSPYVAYDIEKSQYGPLGKEAGSVAKMVMPEVETHLGSDFVDVEWEFVQGAIGSLSLGRYLIEAAADKNAKLNIAVCIPDSNSAIATAMYLPREVYSSVNQVLVYQRGGENLINELRGGASYAIFKDKLRPFGMAYWGYDYNMVDVAERIANSVNNDYQTICESKQVEALADRLCDTFASREVLINAKTVLYDMVKRYVESEEDTERVEKLENDLYAENEIISTQYSKSGLKKTDAAKRWSSIYNANMLWTKLRCIGYKDGCTSLTDKQLWDISLVEHNRWNMEQLLMTYRPLTQDEHILVFMRHSELLKEVLKGKMAHYNICSWPQLMSTDSTYKLDVGFTQNLIKYYNEAKIAK